VERETQGGVRVEIERESVRACDRKRGRGLDVFCATIKKADEIVDASEPK
jgi:hypothetical protein